jgi:hypothetical protein
MSYLSIINNDRCNKCILSKESCDIHSRNDFINNCLPFFNMKNSNINILNFDKDNYIFYDQNNTNTYFINKDFKFIKFDDVLPIYTNFTLYDYIEILNLFTFSFGICHQPQNRRYSFHHRTLPHR